MAGLWDFLSNNANQIVGGGINYFAGQNANKGNQSAANNYFNQAQFQPYNINTAFGNSTFDGNNANATLSPQYQQQADQWRNYGNGLFTQLGDGSAQALGDQQLALLRQLSQPYEDRQRSTLDQNLFNRGSLGSTGGALQSRALYEAQGTADLQRQLQSINLAQAERKSLFDMANTALNNDMNIQSLPITQLALGGQLGAQRSSANAQAGAAPYNAATAGNANDLQFWQSLAGTLGNFSNGAGVAKGLTGLLGGTASDAAGAAGTAAETFGVPAGTTTGIGGASPVASAGSQVASGIGGTNSISSSLWGTGAELAAGTNALLGSGTGLFASGAGSQAAMLAGQNLGLEGATGLTQQALASNIGTGLNSGDALVGSGSAAALFGPVAMIGAAKFIDSLRGGSVESAKAGKLSTQLQKDMQADPTGQTAYNTMEKLVTNKLWPNEGNQWVIRDLVKAGTIPLTMPALYGETSVYNPFSKTLPMEEGGLGSFAKSAGLNAQQTAELTTTWNAYTAARNKAEYAANGDGGSGATFAQSKADAAKAKYEALVKSYEPQRKANAQNIYTQLRGSGYMGDLSKLEKYLGVK